MPQKIVLVVGASSGLGSVAAQCLAADGHIVYAAARSFANGAEPPTGCRALALDVSAADSVHAAVDTVLREQGRVDALVCCAASFTMSPMEELPIDILADMMNVNFLGMARCVQAVMPAMRAQKSGRIVNLSSVAGAIPIPFQAFYSASKAAINSYTMALANEIKPFGVQVCCVQPGDIQTGFTAARQKIVVGDDIYGGRISRSVAGMEKDERTGMKPEDAGAFVCRVATRKGIRPINTIGLSYKFFCVLQKLLPAKTLNWLVGMVYAR